MTCSLKLLGHEKPWEEVSLQRGWGAGRCLWTSQRPSTPPDGTKAPQDGHLILYSDLYSFISNRKTPGGQFSSTWQSSTGSPLGCQGNTFWDDTISTVKSSSRLRWTPSTSRPEENKRFISEPSQRPWTLMVKRSWYKPTFRPIVESSGGSTDLSHVSCRTDLRSDTAVKTFTLLFLHKVSNGTMKLFYCYLKRTALYF